MHFPADFKAGMTDSVLLKEVRCRHCGKVFHVCRRCWRGQAYCGDTCRKIHQMESRREAQRRYQRTEKGKETRARAARRRRMKKSKKTVADETATPPKACDIGPPKRPGDRPRCLFCGVSGIVVDRFPRRAYGGKVFSDEIGFG